MKYRLVLLICIFSSFFANAQTREQVGRELRKQRVPHADIVLAQARLETGNFTSRRCKEDKNLFGMKRGKRYAKYKRWQDSVADYKERISSRYVKGDYYAFLRKIGYAEDAAYSRKVAEIVRTSKK